MELVVVRHAEPVRLTAADTNGQAADPGLTERGHAQAGALAQWLVDDGPFTTMLTSPKRRARETAEPIARALGLTPFVDDGIIEYDAHADHYIPMEELRATNDPRLTAMADGRWEEFGAEAPELFRARIDAALDRIVSDHPGERVLAICHGGVINVMLALVLGLEQHLWFEPRYTSVSRIAASRGGVRTIVSVNESAHLRNVTAR